MFYNKAREKFNKGRKEHNQPWDAEHIDWKSEVQDELLDIFNYCELADNALGDELRDLAKHYWKRLEHETDSTNT